MRIKLVAYGRYCDLYSYEKRPETNRRKRRNGGNGVQGNFDGADGGLKRLEAGKDLQVARVQKAVRSEESSRRAAMGFKRLVEANMGGCSSPSLVTITFRDETDDYDVGRRRVAFSIAKCRKEVWMGGSSQRWISVLERHRSGKIHAHAIVWGIPDDVIDAEREERNIASCMNVGYIDVKHTDGAPALALYLAKYLFKAKSDPSLGSKKAYVATRNVRRPYLDTDALLALYFSGEGPVDLSTATQEYRKEYDTVLLGRAEFTRYKLNEYGNQSAGS